MADARREALRAALGDVLAWEDAVLREKAAEVEAMVAALEDDAKRDFLGWVGNALMKATAVAFCYFSFPKLEVGTLNDRREALITEALWVRKCDELLKRIPGIAQFLTGGHGSRLHFLRALFAAVAVHHNVEKAGSCIARVVYREQTQRHEQHGWMTLKEVLRAFCPNVQVTKEGDRWAMQSFELDCHLGEERVKVSLGEPPEPREKDTDLRMDAVRLIFDREVQHRFAVRVEVKQEEAGAGYQGLVLDRQETVMATATGETADQARGAAVFEYMRGRALEAKEAHSEQLLREKSLKKAKEKDERPLTDTERMTCKRNLHSQLKRLLRSLEGVVPEGRPVPLDGFVLLPAVVERLKKKMGSRYAPLLEDDLRDLLENHDPLQRFTTRPGPDGLCVRASYNPNLPDALKKSDPESLKGKCASQLKECEQRGVAIPVVRVVQAEESGQRLLRVEGVPGVRPADLQEELTDQRFIDVSGLDSEFKVYDRPAVEQLPETVILSKSSGDWRNILKKPTCGVFYNFVFLPEEVSAAEERYEAHPPDGVAYSSEGAVAAACGGKPRQPHVKARVDLRRMVGDGWVVRVSRNPDENKSVLLRPADNWHKLAMGQNAVDVHLPLKQYVTAVREGAEWVPFEPPSEDDCSSVSTTPAPSEAGDDVGDLLPFDLEVQEQVIEDYANGTAREPIRVQLPSLLQPGRASQVTALKLHARQFNLSVEESPDHLWLSVGHVGPPLTELKDDLGINDFHNDRLLQNALRHSSMNNAGVGTADAAAPNPPGDATADPADGTARWRGCGGSDYERQEFLGDSVIEVCLAHDMYRYWCRRGCDLSEAERLRRHLSPTLKNETLFRVMGALGVIKKGYIQSATTLSEETHHKIYADVFEALAGALYLGKGLTYAHQKFRQWMAHHEDAINFYAWPEWGTMAADVGPWPREVLMQEDDWHKPSRHDRSKTGWTIDKIMLATEFPKMTHKDFKTSLSTHFKFADVFSSYRRCYNPELLYDRILLAFHSGVVGFTNETITHRTRFCIDVDGKNTEEPVLKGETIEQFLQRRLQDLFPTKDTYCLVLDCSKPPKKYSRHMHWPNLFVDRFYAQGLVRRLQLEALRIVLGERFAALGEPRDEADLPQCVPDTADNSIVGRLAGRLLGWLALLRDPQGAPQPPHGAVGCAEDDGGERVCRKLLEWCDLDQNTATTVRAPDGKVALRFASGEGVVQEAAHHNLTALADWLFQDVENEDKLKVFNAAGVQLLEKCWDHFNGEDGAQRFRALPPADRSALFFVWLKYWDSFNWSKWLDMGVFRSRKLRMYIADKFDLDSGLPVERPVTQARILPRHTAGQLAWRHEPTPVWKQQHPTTPFVHDSANPAPLTHRACLRLASLRNPAHWQENAVCEPRIEYWCQKYCDEAYAQFAWRSSTDAPVVCGQASTRKEDEDEDAGSPAEEQTATESSAGDDVGVEEDMKDVKAHALLQKIDKLRPLSLDFVEYQDGDQNVCEVWQTNNDQLLATYRSKAKKNMKEFAASLALPILRPMMAKYCRPGTAGAAAKPGSGKASKPSQPKAARSRSCAPAPPPMVPMVPEVLAALEELPARPVRLLVPRGRLRWALVRGLAAHRRVLWLFDDSQRADYGRTRYTDTPGTLHFEAYKMAASAQEKWLTDDFWQWLAGAPDGTVGHVRISKTAIPQPPADFRGGPSQLVVFDSCATPTAERTRASHLEANLCCLILTDSVEDTEGDAPNHTATLRYPVPAPFAASRAVLWLPPAHAELFRVFHDKVERLLLRLLVQLRAMADPPHRPLDPKALTAVADRTPGPLNRVCCPHFRRSLADFATSTTASVASLARLSLTLVAAVEDGGRSWEPAVRDAYRDVSRHVAEGGAAFREDLLHALQDLQRYAALFAEFHGLRPDPLDLLPFLVARVLRFQEETTPGEHMAVVLPDTLANQLDPQVLKDLLGELRVHSVGNPEILGKAPLKGRQGVFYVSPALVKVLPPSQQLVLVVGLTELGEAEQLQLLQDLMGVAAPKAEVKFVCRSPQEYCRANALLLDYRGRVVGRIGS